MKVRAVDRGPNVPVGYIGNRRIRSLEVFKLDDRLITKDEDGNITSPKWVEAVDQKTPDAAPPKQLRIPGMTAKAPIGSPRGINPPPPPTEEMGNDVPAAPESKPPTTGRASDDSVI